MALGKQGKPFWAALAHATARAIGVRLLGNVRNSVELHAADTIWLKATDLRPHLGTDLPLPSENAVFRTIARRPRAAAVSLYVSYDRIRRI